ncbi:MAG TPA: outer membrane protein assembly factor BamE [Allosphingosinicella sp.]|jgi:outer membrane protein assembly factor BamE (lipoprotein component of BamABCDE complex)
MMGVGRKAALSIAVAAGLATGGCSKVKDFQGFILDDTLVSAIQPGVDNKDSVVATLGRPSFTSTFDQNEWFYVTRRTRNYAFSTPDPHTQTVLRVRFDQAGNVASVEKKGMEQVVSIDPSSSKTPTLGRDKSFWEELFGNIGAVGSGATGGSGPTP